MTISRPTQGQTPTTEFITDQDTLNGTGIRICQIQTIMAYAYFIDSHLGKYNQVAAVWRPCSIRYVAYPNINLGLVSAGGVQEGQTRV